MSSALFSRARRRKLLNKAKTLLEDDTSQENEENYARRLMQGDVNSMSSLTNKHGGVVGGNCHGEYTQMWELRRSQAGLGQQVMGSDSGLDSTYSTGTASISGQPATLPTCCGNSKTTFITFKPREPIYDRGRYGINTLMPKNVNGGVPFGGVYFELDPSVDRHTESDSADDTYKRPDLITNSAKKNGEAMSLKSNTLSKNNCSDRQCNNGGLRDLCDHCVLHPVVDNKPKDDSESSVQPTV